MADMDLEERMRQRLTELRAERERLPEQVQAEYTRLDSALATAIAELEQLLMPPASPLPTQAEAKATEGTNAQA